MLPYATVLPWMDIYSPSNRPKISPESWGEQVSLFLFWRAAEACRDGLSLSANSRPVPSHADRGLAPRPVLPNGSSEDVMWAEPSQHLHTGDGFLCCSPEPWDHHMGSLLGGEELRGTETSSPSWALLSTKQTPARQPDCSNSPCWHRAEPPSWPQKQENNKCLLFEKPPRFPRL